MRNVIVDGIEVIRDGMIILPSEITKKLQTVGKTMTFPCRFDGRLSMAEIDRLTLRPIYRLPLKRNVVQEIESRYDEFMKRQKDIALIERIRINKERCVDTFNKSYDEQRLLDNISCYVRYKQQGLASSLLELFEKEIIMDVAIALTEIISTACYSTSECFEKGEYID